MTPTTPIPLHNYPLTVDDTHTTNFSPYYPLPVDDTPRYPLPVDDTTLYPLPVDDNYNYNYNCRLLPLVGHDCAGTDCINNCRLELPLHPPHLFPPV